MKVVSSLRSLKNRFRDCRTVVRRTRTGKKRVYVISKQGRAKARQG